MVQKINKERIVKVIIVLFCLVFIVLEFIPITYTVDAARSGWIGRILSNTCAIVAVIGLMSMMKIKGLKHLKNAIYIIPAAIIALANFPLVSYLNGNMQVIRKQWMDVVLFIVYCISVGILEELIFRGVLFSVLVNYYSKDSKGLIKAYVISSVLFGVAHLTNIIRGAGVGATILQALYTTLTGGLFCFVLIKTRNLLCCAGIHALYNVCGLIFETPMRLGLGTGVVFDFGTGILMAVIDVIVGIFVLYSVFKHKEEDRIDLYEQLGIQ